MRTILSFATLIAVGLALPTTDQDNGWAAFKARFGKVYADPQEELMRMDIFLENKAQVDMHNALFSAGLSTFEKAVNHLTDWAQEEITANAKGLIPPSADREGVEFHEPSGESIPDTVDWRTKGAVTGVKDQGGCGSCYAFSATGALEGQYAIKKSQKVSLSEQQIVDCSFGGCYGCNGGLPDAIFNDIAAGQPNGLELEKDYPYAGSEETCNFNKSEITATDQGFKQIPSGDEASLKEAVANIGPISVAIVATENFKSYAGGIFNDPSCTSESTLDHAVLIVGYGEENGHDYWLVKNSWGESWGDNGYIKMARNAENMCRIADLATYPEL